MEYFQSLPGIAQIALGIVAPAAWLAVSRTLLRSRHIPSLSVQKAQARVDLRSYLRGTYAPALAITACNAIALTAIVMYGTTLVGT
jgi:hypothetical protein